MTLLLWMAYAALCAAVLAAAGTQLERLAAERRRAQRGIWAATIVASVLIPAALGLRPPMHGSAASDAAAVGAARAVARANVAGVLGSASSDMIVLITWSVLSALLAVLFAVSYWRTTRALRLFRRTVVAGQAALVSDDFGPALVGVVRPRIVLPGWALRLGAAEQELVVAHESEHRRAHDPMLLVAGVATVVLLPWNAALWFQLLRLRTAIELDCDARVVDRHHHDPIAYGRLLLNVRELAGRASRTHARPMLAFLRTESSLLRRVHALALPRSGRGPSLLAAVGAAALLAGVTAFVPAPSVRSVLKEFGSQKVVDFTLHLEQLPAPGLSSASAATYKFDGSAAAKPVRRSNAGPSSAGPMIVSTVPPVRVAEPVFADVLHPTPAQLPEQRRRTGGAIIRAAPDTPAQNGPRGGFVARPRAPGDSATFGRVIRAVGNPTTPKRDTLINPLPR